MKYGLLLVLVVLKILNADASEHFNTTLKSQITVAGEECVSDTAVAGRLDHKWTEFSCTPGEWIFLIGSEEDFPFIGKLEKSDLRGDDEFEYFKIIPTIPVDATRRWILRSHQLRVSLNGESEVVKVR